MRVLGVLLLLVGGLVLFNGCVMDTSVPLETEPAKRIHNLGLMRDQQNAIMIGLGLMVIGAIFMAMGRRRPVEQSSGTKTCPYCAETIKAAATVCRFCGKELPQSATSPEVSTAKSAISPAVSMVTTVDLTEVEAAARTKFQRYAWPVIISVAVLAVLASQVKPVVEEWIREREVQQRHAEFESNKQTILKQVSDAVSANEMEGVKDVLDRYRDVPDADLTQLRNRVQILELTKEYERIPKSLMIAREGAIDELTRLDPTNPRWRQEWRELQRVRILELAKEYEAIPKDQRIARERAISELTRLDPTNPRWGREWVELKSGR